MFSKVLVANRGAIACRIIRTLKRMGVGSVAVYSEADRHSLHVFQADEAVCIGPPQAAQSYLNFERIFEAIGSTGAEAVHPGYGFLSENSAFAEACESRGIVFIGPTPEQMKAFGLKHTARDLAMQNKVPLLPGTGVLSDVDEAVAEATRIGYPVMLKSSAGGGGIGMRLCRKAAELRDAYESVERLSKSNFGNSALFLEKFVQQARHVEVQIFGDGKGKVVALGERDCSVQRRNQKVIEETPAPGLTDEARAELFESAVRLGQSVQYRSAGTVEYVYDNSTGKFYFLEVNTRLQVEHGVTEEVTGIDLVEWMVRQAADELSIPESIQREGHSLQVRVYAEDPAKNFQPSSGRLSQAVFSNKARVETWVETGSDVTPFYDPLLAKIIVHGADRRAAIQKMRNALASTQLSGLETNLEYLRQICGEALFALGGVTTSFLQTVEFHRATVEVLESGTQTTVQDYPGRLGYWHVGVPPSGPMDPLAFRLANRLVGNDGNAAGLEVTISGPTLRFDCDTAIAVCGADMSPTLDGKPIALWRAVRVRPGSVLRLGAVEGPGMRCYLAFRGGLAVPEYLGSRSTFILGKFGGHAGRVLRPGDILHVGSATEQETADLPSAVVPAYSDQWEIGVLYGPHGAPDFFKPEDIDAFFDADWKVHHNSDRTGVRLIGPKPQWARPDGGEAGLHPSNIHDNAYAIGTVDFTGDMPVLLGPDGPSLGGFVCPATIVQAELWKLGQLKPGDTVRFRAISQSGAEALERAVELSIATVSEPLPALPKSRREPAVLRRNGDVVCRADGDRYLLVEYGPNVLDFHLRFRVHALEQWVRAARLPGIIDITPGMRSLHIHYNSLALSRHQLLEALDGAEGALKSKPDFEIPTRIVHLPLSWDDPQTQLAISKYMQSVRPDAPWCPSNIEFIRRINGLASVDDVYRTVFDASYMVLGLGDVYLGAPVATPVDPRHRLVTTKYNPARTWTPENAVGIGGAYLCVYGMEGPGGYQFVGRTVQMWNTHKVTANFEAGTPWLLRFFDEIRFHPVSAKQLLEYRDAFPHGRYEVKTETSSFQLSKYDNYLASIAPEAAAAKARQQAAFDAERERWVASGQNVFNSEPPAADTSGAESAVPEGCDPVRSPITASVWSVAVQPGERVTAGQRLLVLEAMKMEVAVSAPRAGIIEELRCVPGALVNAGQNLLVMR